MFFKYFRSFLNSGFMPLLGAAENQRSVDDGGSPNVGRGVHFEVDDDGGSPNVGRGVHFEVDVVDPDVDDIIDPPNVGLDGVVLEEDVYSPGGVVGGPLNVSRGGSLNYEDGHGSIENTGHTENDNNDDRVLLNNLENKNNNDDASDNADTNVAGKFFSYII